MLGLVLGYFTLFLMVFIYPAIAIPRYLDMRDDYSLQQQEFALSHARGACELARAEAQGAAFSCETAQDALTPMPNMTISIRDQDTGSCLISATAHGSGTPSTELWSYDP